MNKKFKFYFASVLIASSFLMSTNVQAQSVFSRLSIADRQRIVSYIQQILETILAELAKLIAQTTLNNTATGGLPTPSSSAIPANQLSLPAGNLNLSNSPESLSLPPAPPASTSLFLERIDPPSGRPGTTITIYGRGFSLTSNTLYTGYSQEDNISSPDGKTIKFSIAGPDVFPLSEACDDCEGGMSPKLDQDLWFYVQNSTGVSNGLKFKLQE